MTCTRTLGWRLGWIIAAVLLIGTGVFAQKTTVTVLADFRPAYLEWTQVLKERFEAENPEIEIELIPMKEHADSLETIQVQLAAGMPLDIAWADPMYIMSLARMGVLEDLAPYVARTDQYADYYPSSFRLFQAGDSLYALPFELQIASIFYNVPMLQEAGLPLPDRDWTYDDLRWMAVRLLEKDADGNAIRHGFKIPTGRNWLTIVWAYGGDFLDDWVSPTRFTGNTSEVQSALEYMNDLVRSEAVQDRQRHNQEHVTTVAFPRENVGMILTNTISIPTLQDLANFAWDVAALPEGPAGRVGFINSRGWMLFRTARDKEAAWRVLEYFTSPEAMELLVELTSMVPPNRDALVNRWMPTAPVPANRSVFLEGLAEARSPWPFDGDLFRIIQSEADKAIWGEVAPGVALQHIEERLVPQMREVYGN